jgi:hypothetical protein
MRHLVVTNFPVLSRRIHRCLPDEDDGGEGADPEWKWLAAEGAEGLFAWAEVAMTDLEAGQATKETGLQGDSDNNRT